MVLRCFYVLLFIFFLAGTAAAAPQVNVQLDRSKVYEGEKFAYKITVSDDKPVSGRVIPDMSAFGDFDVQALPESRQQNGGMRATIIINGRTVKDDASAMTYSVQFPFVLTPKRTGTLHIPPPKLKEIQVTAINVTVSGGGSGEQDGSVRVQVIPPEKQDTVQLQIMTDRQKLYPLQPLTVSLIVRIQQLSGNTAQRDPLTLLKQPPQLTVPWLDPSNKNLPAAVKTLEETLQMYFVRSPQRGFALNELGETQMSMGFNNDDFFSNSFGAGLFQKVLYQFSNTPKIVQFGGNNYWEYRFDRTFVPKEIKTYSFGPATLKGVLPAGEPAAGQTFYVVAPAVSVNVSDVPADNRPADYIGAFGKYRLEADIVPKNAKVGDPLTLTLKLAGEGSTANVKAPDLTAITENFRVHMPPTEENNEQTCTYTYTIRPLKSGTYSVPIPAVSVFDVAEEKFVQLRSDAIPLNIGTAETVDAAAVFAQDRQYQQQQDIAQIALMVSKYTGLMIGGLGLLYTLWKIGKLSAAFFRRQPKNLRQRNALHRLEKRLNRKNGLRDLQSALFGYAADKADVIEDGITTADAAAIFEKLQYAPETVAALRTFLEKLDAVQYGGLPAPPMEQLSTELNPLLAILRNKG